MNSVTKVHNIGRLWLSSLCEKYVEVADGSGYIPSQPSVRVLLVENESRCSRARSMNVPSYVYIFAAFSLMVCICYCQETDLKSTSHDSSAPEHRSFDVYVIPSERWLPAFVLHRRGASDQLSPSTFQSFTAASAPTLTHFPPPTNSTPLTPSL